MKIVRWTAVLLGVAVTTSVTTLSGASAEDESQFADVRAATADYREEAAALAAGYKRTDECVPGMGYHYIHPELYAAAMDRRRIVEPDPLKPPALIYAPDGEDGRELIGVEYFVVDRDQQLRTHNRPIPTLFRTQFDGPMPGHFDGMPVHYDLHAYIWTTNPRGTLSAINPDVDCPEP